MSRELREQGWSGMGCCHPGHTPRCPCTDLVNVDRLWFVFLMGFAWLGCAVWRGASRGGCLRPIECRRCCLARIWQVRTAVFRCFSIGGLPGLVFLMWRTPLRSPCRNWRMWRAHVLFSQGGGRLVLVCRWWCVCCGDDDSKKSGNLVVRWGVETLAAG